MKRAAVYVRISTIDQHPETQLHDLRQHAAQRGLQIVQEYVDHGFCGARARRPALDKMTEDARRHKFDVLLVWSCDRLARNTKHLLQTLDEPNGMGIQFMSQREAIDTEGPLGRAIIVIVSAMAELERCIIIERVRAGMRWLAMLANHAVILVIALALIAWLSKGNFPVYGLQWPKHRDYVMSAVLWGAAFGLLMTLVDYFPPDTEAHSAARESSSDA